MVLYKCLCGYETKDKTKMTRHLNSKKSCSDKAMTEIDIETLIVGNRLRQNLSNLSIEERKERHNKQTIIFNTKRKMLGMSITNFSKDLLHNMINSSNRRNHEHPPWIFEDIIDILDKNKNYVIKDTVLGNLEFPLILTNGYFNTASFDRIDDNLPYSNNNIEIRPRFLNTRYKLSNKIFKILSN